MNSLYCYQRLRCDLDITPNSHDYPTKKSTELVRRINDPILGMKGLKSLGKVWPPPLFGSVPYKCHFRLTPSRVAIFFSKSCKVNYIDQRKFS